MYKKVKKKFINLTLSLKRTYHLYIIKYKNYDFLYEESTCFKRMF